MDKGILLYIFLADLHRCFGQTYSQLDGLKTTVLTGYNTDIRPLLDQSQVLQVNVSMSLFNLGIFNEVTGLFQIVAVVESSWVDEKLQWTPTSHGDVSDLLFRPSEIWIPPLLVANPFDDPIDMTQYDFMRIRVSHSGSATWEATNNFAVSCSVDVAYYPDDSQTCIIQIFTASYLESEIILNPVMSGANMDQLSTNGEWLFTGSSVLLNTISGRSAVNFSITMHRRSAYEVLNFLLPMIMLSMLNSLVFLLPAESGERISFAVTLLLALSVFFTLIANYLPSSSKPMPIIGYYLLIVFLLSCYICVAVIMNMRLYHKDDRIPVPRWWKTLTLLVKADVFSHSSKAKVDSAKPSNRNTTSTLVRQGTGLKDNHGHPVEEENTQTTWKDVSLAVDKCHVIVLGVLQLIVSLVFIVVIFSQ